EEAGGEFIIELEDSADPALLNLFPKVQLLIEEAVMTGEFTLLEKRVHQLAQSYNSLGDVTLDRNYVYLRLQNERGMLQRVISRGREEGRIKIGAGRVATDAEVG
ncbi:MAG TPA: hypothetical protein GX528_06220, partial [Firmicutes bacterium]|nr:hypothetical protein [Bacillota bacterium]